MRLVAAVLVAGAVSLAACGAVPAAGSPLTPVQLKYRLVEQVGPIEYCDRDQYPLAREVTPDYVDQQLAYIRAHDPQVYQAILDHYQLSAPTTDQQKLQVYQDYKALAALQLQPEGDRYDLSYGVSPGADQVSRRAIPPPTAGGSATWRPGSRSTAAACSRLTEFLTRGRLMTCCRPVPPAPTGRTASCWSAR